MNLFVLILDVVIQRKRNSPNEYCLEPDWIAYYLIKLTSTKPDMLQNGNYLTKKNQESDVTGKKKYSPDESKQGDAIVMLKKLRL